MSLEADLVVVSPLPPAFTTPATVYRWYFSSWRVLVKCPFCPPPLCPPLAACHDHPSSRATRQARLCSTSSCTIRRGEIKWDPKPISNPVGRIHWGRMTPSRFRPDRMSTTFLYDGSFLAIQESRINKIPTIDLTNDAMVPTQPNASRHFCSPS